MKSRRIALAGSLIAATMLPGASNAADDYFEDRFGARVGIYFNLPFAGGLKAARQQSFEYGLRMNFSQDYRDGFGGLTKTRFKFDAVNLSFSRYGFSSLSLAGQPLMRSDLLLRADDDGEGGQGLMGDNGIMILGGVGLIALGALAVFSGGNDMPDACIAIFPKPPGCP